MYGVKDMLEFEESWFRDEEREEFLVTEEVKRGWAAQLVIVKEIEEVCKKYGLTYFTAWGTTLGAVRHKGFIPWDDDLDICMKRADYMKFISVWRKEFPERYSLLHHDTEDGYVEFMCRLVNQRSFDLSEEHLKKFCGCPYIVGVDIFPLDYIPRNQEDLDFSLHLLHLVYTAAREWDACINPEDIEKREVALAKIEETCQVKIDRNQNVTRQLMDLSERLCMLYGEDESDALGFMVLQIPSPGFVFQKKGFEKAIDMPFEITTLPVPAGYEDVLVKSYGEDWRTPVKQWGTHDYPFFNNQKPFLEEYKRTGQNFESTGVAKR